jgi:hypothetical protein
VFFAHYVALGDSMSVDMYAALDRGETDVAVALERVPDAGVVAPLGAASLLYANSDEHWPEESGADLSTRYPGITFRNLATTGATIGDVFGEQLMELEESEEPTLVSLTLGGDDLFSAFASKPGASLQAGIVRDIAQAWDLVVDRILETRPNALVLATTVYDPSDGTGDIPGVLSGTKLPVAMIEALNAHIRTAAAREPRAVLADVHAHFLGHGATVPEEERWYWRRAMLEPSAQGAHEIRRVWLEAIERAELEAAE